MFSDGRRTVFWVGCACVGAYVAYRYWKKRELKSIDEGFDEVTKIDDSYERRVLLLGLDGAGKTSLMNQMCIANGMIEPYKAPSSPTQGFTVYRLENGYYTYNVWEIGGAENNRKYWSTFLQDTDLLIFMVDASDTSKLSLAVSTLKQLLGDSRMDTVPILVIANKQDASNALRPDQVKEALDLQSISPHKHKVEVIGCQTRPLPDLHSGATEYTWYHSSVNAIRKKVFSMAIS
ncbi:hypothetical protein HZH66_003892 [Vespula vulgaris]|uniref:ADP-ribosylation factor-like protein 3 n=1 Tax=Vespula vulgaris TaxID=7454 RepID=A0A834KJ47_VESVU|nr:uncharacterized protein LOC127062468 [Vespula vulgaris]KAF7404986.1 hypothetical protein HZH66_003892 [Vespula vulgaris]